MKSLVSTANNLSHNILGITYLKINLITQIEPAAKSFIWLWPNEGINEDRPTMMRLSDIVQRGLFLWDMETKNAKLHVHLVGEEEFRPHVELSVEFLPACDCRRRKS
ncbi:unnamed protein product [Prunus armeniaca]|uniref:Uncharacterized protein n=1 Tax=Prunus armeniaca TaxID=36596 RepID=A0A6J5VHJ8_PRUAR|nr:unnamed protein product [Prunus armeniaca]